MYFFDKSAQSDVVKELWVLILKGLKHPNIVSLETNSFKTPLGMHSIQSMIGDGAETYSIFKARINTQLRSKVIHEHIDTDNDFVTSRILWLTGEEPGKNSGTGIDSYSRYIYIHGTQEEGLIGSKASHGCIRMFNEDVIRLYDIVKKGTKVNILI